MLNYSKHFVAWRRGLVAATLLVLLFLPSHKNIEKSGNNIFDIYLNETFVGVSPEEDVTKLLISARREVASGYDDMIFADAELRVEGREVLFGRVDSDRSITERMTEVLRGSILESQSRSYTIKINDYTVNLRNSKDVIGLLNNVIGRYDELNQYNATLVMDPEREIGVLTTRVERRNQGRSSMSFGTGAGIDAFFEATFDAIEPAGEKDFDDFELGLKDLGFADKVEVVEAYLPATTLTELETAIEQVTKEQEKNKIYEVQSGDTLSEIAEMNELTLDRLIEINPSIENANSTIRVGDEIIVTSPEPELSVTRVEEMFYEEFYDAEIEYVPNDSWYTNQMQTLQQPSAGHRKVVALVTYKNGVEVGRELEKEEVLFEAVPKIVERGTKIPPSFIKPISGGRLSSTFGRRKAPKKGASTYHKGIDWAIPVGTAVMASSGGTVTKAGWGSGYGYCVYITNGNMSTRYGHLSKVLVSVGQSVSQGQKIALSGNSGISTGPHLHFEILVGGSQVNPAKYLS